MGQAGGTEGALPVRALPYEELLQGVAEPVACSTSTQRLAPVCFDPSSGCCAGRDGLSSREGWTTSRFCSTPAGWSS